MKYDIYFSKVRVKYFDLIDYSTYFFLPFFWYVPIFVKEMATRLGASVQVVRQRRIEGTPERIVAEILVRKVPEDQQAIGIGIKSIEEKN